MATPGRPLPEQDRRQIERLRAAGVSVRKAARIVGVSTRTVQKILKMHLQSNTLSEKDWVRAS